MKSILLAAALASTATFAAAADKYVLDASHSQVLFSYNHLGFSTTYGMFSGLEGEINFDQEHPEKSSVAVTIPVSSMFTGWEKREAHFSSEDFFGVEANPLVTFTSTSIEVTGEAAANITGDLTMNGTTKSVVLDATLSKTGIHPQAQKEWAGFDATITLLRSEFGMGIAVPFVSDEVEVTISIEAMKAE